MGQNTGWRRVTAAHALATFIATAPTAYGQELVASGPPLLVHVNVDASKPIGPLKQVWNAFGADEPNYALMRDGQTLLSHLGALRPGDVYFRTHNLLTTGNGSAQFKWGSTNIYTEDAAGEPVYDWTIVDRIIDAYESRGISPYLQLGFMPKALASAAPSTPYQPDWRPGFAYNLIAGGWNSPPTDYGKWAELVYQWTRHNLQRYGAERMSHWYFETWNEANLPDYWTGSKEDFLKLHDYTVDAIRRAYPAARVGGPELARAGGDLMDAFLTHVTTGINYATGQVGTPTDFLSFHAKGEPRFVSGHVEMGIASHLNWVEQGFAKIGRVPQLASKPVVLGESDPEGCAACPGPQNAYRNGTLYASYEVESIFRILQLADRDKINVGGIITWAFEFEEQPYFAGYRQLASQGLDLPVLNAFRLLAKLGDTQVEAKSDAELPLQEVMAQGVRGAPDIGVLASRNAAGETAVLVWNYHDDDVPGPVAQVQVSLSGVHTKVSTEWQVDGIHGNAFTAWLQAGSPQSPDAKQYASFQQASQLVPTALPLSSTPDGRESATVAVPRQGVALITFSP